MLMKPDAPIVSSLLRNDTYKALMSRFAHEDPEKYWNRPVRYRLKNRTTSVQLARVIAPVALTEQLRAVRELKFTEEEIAFIATINPNLAKPSYLDALRGVRLPDFKLGVTEDGQFDLTVEGTWGNSTWWEIPILSVITAMYVDAVMS